MLLRDEGRTATVVRASAPDLPVDGVGFQPEQALNSQASPAAIKPDIRALTLAVRRGDADAFSDFYDHFSFRLYKFLLVLARGDENEAREVCQAVFIKLARRCDIFDEEHRLWAWMCVLAKNTFVDHYRARQRHNRFESLAALPAEPDGGMDSDLRLSEILHEALAALAPDDRELLQAAYVDKRPLRELANEAGQTYKAVESRLGRLRQRLKGRLLKDLRNENVS